MSSGVGIKFEGACKNCKMKKLQLTSMENWSADGSEFFYELHCQHEEICRMWEDKINEVIKNENGLSKSDIETLDKQGGRIMESFLYRDL